MLLNGQNLAKLNSRKDQNNKSLQSKGRSGEVAERTKLAVEMKGNSMTNQRF